jgi:acetyl esterase/lipase
MWGLKVYVSALSPVLVLIGLITAIVGLATGSTFISLLGIFVVFIFSFHLISVTRPPDASTSFENAFGVQWENNIKPEQKAGFLPSRTTLQLPVPVVPNPRLEQNIAFATIPGTDRQLLCDVWQPPEGVSPSGVAFIYLHGSAFYFLDKDYGTRLFLSHLAAQGHVIMDVFYRLAPETDLMGMVQDVKRAIVWMKEHASTYCIYPARIVVGGGSAGGHLALLAAYTSSNPQFTPGELAGKGISVCSVISLYGTNDLKALYYHTHLTTRTIPGKPKKAVPAKMPQWLLK